MVPNPILTDPNQPHYYIPSRIFRPCDGPDRYSWKAGPDNGNNNDSKIALL